MKATGIYAVLVEKGVDAAIILLYELITALMDERSKPDVPALPAPTPATDTENTSNE